MVTDTEGMLLAGLFSSDAMEYVWSPSRQVQEMLRFEWALSAALEECGLAQTGAATSLATLLETRFLTRERADALRAGAAKAGNVAIPFVKMLTEAVGAVDAAAARVVHTGATSQDVLDTALVLQTREALSLIADLLDATLARCVVLARRHRDTILVGRTWLQQGPPVTLGLKFAGHAAALGRHRDRLREMRERVLVLQFGGAVGTLASLGTDGLRVSAALARHLGLAEPVLPWHTHRDGLAEVATVLGLLTATLGKVARDISLSMQTEVGELLEPAGEGRGGSSTMPHKRNPVGCAVVLAAAVRVPPLVATMLAAMTQEHERGLGGWHAEWETLPQIMRLSAGALARIHEILEGLEVNAQRMASNLETTQGLILAEAASAALARHMGRTAAHDLVEAASRQAIAQGSGLKDVLMANAEVGRSLSVEELDRVFEYANYLGSSGALVDRVVRTMAAKKE